MQESDIRPAELFQEYLELCRKDAFGFFANSKRKKIPCPGCGSADAHNAFEKWGFGYVICNACLSLYQSPRPPAEVFARFYQDSPSARYWSETFFPAVAETRRLSLFRPKVIEIAGLCQKDNFVPGTVVDVGAGWGLLLEEWRRIFPEAELIAIEPNSDLAARCRAKNLKVVQRFAEEVSDFTVQGDLLIALEVIEHAYEPLSFCMALNKLIRKGGKILLTGLTVDGFDIQVLWERSKSIFPPHHINFLSIEGFRKLFNRAGFSQPKIFTPGKIDVDIVKNTMREHPEFEIKQRFIHHLIKQDDRVIKNFQQFLSENCLSSHCWVWAEK